MLTMEEYLEKLKPHMVAMAAEGPEGQTLGEEEEDREAYASIEKEVESITSIGEAYGFISQMLCGDSGEVCMAMLEPLISDWDDKKARGIPG